MSADRARRRTGSERRRRASPLALGLLLAAGALSTAAGEPPFGVVRDGSLGAAPAGPVPARLECDYCIDEALGERRGGNLFHGFSRFDVGPGERATFFTGSDVDHVVARVRGPASRLQGTIGLEGSNADLFLLNPAGVMIGSGFALDLPAAFHVSTAGALHFADGATLSVGDDAPVLSEFDPVAHGFLGGGRAAAIGIEGAGFDLPATLSLAAGDVVVRSSFLTGAGRELLMTAVGGSAVDVSLDPTGLDPAAAGIDPSASVALDLGRVSVDRQGQPGGGRIVVRGGQLVVTNGMQVISDGRDGGPGLDLALADSVELSSGAQVIDQFALDPGPVAVRIRADTLSLSGGARLAAAGSGAVDVVARVVELDGGTFQSLQRDAASATEHRFDAEELTLRGGARFLLQSQDDAAAADLGVTAERITLDGGSIVSTGAGGAAGGDVQLVGGRLVVRDGEVRVESVGPGGTGDLSVTVDELALEAGASTPGVLVVNGGAGSGPVGRIDVDVAGDLVLRGGGQIASISDGEQPSGDVNVTVGGLLEARGRSPDDVSSGIFSRTLDTDAPGVGAPGRLTIHAGTIELSDGATFSTRSLGRFAAGRLEVSAGERIAIGGGLDQAEISARNQDGDGEGLRVSAPEIELVDGGTIAASTIGAGDAGGIEVVTDRLLVAGANASGAAVEPSSIISSSGQGVQNGDGGRIAIRAAGSVEVADGGRIAAFSTGDGDAGSIGIETPVLRVRGGIVSSETTATGGGGDIRVDASRVALESGGQLRATASGSADAGAITLAGLDELRMQEGRIDTTSAAAGGGNVEIGVEGLVALEDSAIATDVRTGRDPGGNVRIARPAVFTLNGSVVTARADLGAGGDITIDTGLFLRSADSEVDASSNAGVNGIVAVRPPDTELLGALRPLEGGLLDVGALARTPCAAREGESSLVLRPRPLPPEPGDWRRPLAPGEPLVIDLEHGCRQPVGGVAAR